MCVINCGAFTANMKFAGVAAIHSISICLVKECKNE